MFTANTVHRNAISNTPRRIIACYRRFMLVRVEPQYAPAYYEYYACDGRYLCCATRSASYVLLRLRTAQRDNMALCATPYVPQWYAKRLAFAARAAAPSRAPFIVRSAPRSCAARIALGFIGGYALLCLALALRIAFA